MSDHAVLPAVFLSHGTPMLAFAEDAYVEALRSLAASFPRPRVIEK